MHVNTANPAQGEYNYIHTSKGNNDECYTHAYAVYPLLEFMAQFRNKIIWCPFSTSESEFVKVFLQEGFNVVYSHIDYGQDYYFYEPKHFDVIIDNPPFTGKRHIINRALSFNKPFALLQPLPCLNDRYPKGLFYEQKKDLQILMFPERMTFKNQAGKKNEKINFSSAYFCWNFLPKDIVIRDFTNRKQLRMAV